MGWFNALKRALRSPNRDNKTTRSRDFEEPEAYEKKRDKRRWLFRIPASQIPQQTQTDTTSLNIPPTNPPSFNAADYKHALAVPAAEAKAKVVVASVQAPIEYVTFTRPPSYSLKHHYAAIIIQTSFRRYLARKARRALQGIVTLQALIRGQIVRKQAKMTLKCMTALLRVQARVRDHRARYSHDGGGRKSMFAETNNLWESGYLQDIRARKSQSREGSSIAESWDDRPHTVQELEAILQSRKEAAFMRETSLSSSFSQQVWKSGRNSSIDEKDVGDRTNWLEQWMARKQWENNSRASTDHKRELTRTAEVDTSRASYYSASNGLKSQYINQYQRQPSLNNAASLHYREPYSPSLQLPVTPLSKTKSLQVRSASPRCIREDRSYSTANTPNLHFTPHANASTARYSTCGNDGAAIPNYMAATESAKARVRSQSAPRQSRPSTPEREPRVAAKKRLSYGVADPCVNAASYSQNLRSPSFKSVYPVADPCINAGSFSQNLRSPSFKSVQAGYVGMGQQSCYTDSTGGEISPCSTTELGKWLR